MKLKKAISVILVMILTFSLGCVPCSFSASENITGNKVMQAFLDKRMEDDDINGVAYVTKNGELVCSSVRGFANKEQEKEMTLDTLFPIGSNSKLFCTAAIMLLQEQGKLDVNDSMEMYFPDYTVAKDVTIKNLLTMRSGICEHTEYTFVEYTLSTEATEQENEEIILEWLYTKELLFEPGKDFEYTNTNYFLLSLIVEKVSHQRYQEFIRENIFEPLKMNDTGFYEELINSPDLAQHTAPPSEFPIEPEVKGLTQGAGDLVSNAKDMDKWMTSFKECTILTKESIEEITTSYTKDTGFGYGIGVIGDGGLMYFGGIVSYLSGIVTYPDEGVNVFVVSNDYQTGLSGVVESLTIDLAYEVLHLGILGDVNSDKFVNIKDVTLIQKQTAELVKFSDKQYQVGDVNSDGTVNIKDATAIQKYCADIDTGYNIGKVMS